MNRTEYANAIRDLLAVADYLGHHVYGGPADQQETDAAHVVRRRVLVERVLPRPGAHAEHDARGHHRDHRMDDAEADEEVLGG